MQQRVKNVICLLSAAVLLAGSLSAAFGAAHARYRVTQALPWVFHQPTAQTTNTSNLLVAGGQTVVLQDWQLPTATGEDAAPVQNERTVSFTVSDKTAVKDDLWVEPDSYLDAQFTVADGLCTITLTLTEAAYALTQSTMSTVRIGWGRGALSAELKVKLCVGEEAPIVSGSAAKVMASSLDKQLALIVSGQPFDCIFQIYAGSGEQVRGLRCSTDGGHTWTMLYDTQIFAFTPPQDWNGLLLLDLSGTGLVGGTKDLTVRGDGTGSVSTIAALPDSQMNTAPFFLTGERTLPIQTNWLGCTFHYELQTLTQTADGLRWLTAEKSAGLQVSSQNGNLVLRLNGYQLPAGQYRLVMTWRMDGKIIYQSKAEFFVNYL